jgi:hypothetical protein
MTTSESDRTHAPRRTLSTTRFLVACAAGLVAVGALWLAFTLAGEPDTAAGALVGGAGVIGLMAVVRWRALRKGSLPDTGFGRSLVGAADERDTTIFSSSLAYVGIAAFLANAAGMAAVALGADGSMVLGAIELILLAVLVGSSIVLSRRI